MEKSRERCVANRKRLMWRVEVQFEIVIQAVFEQSRLLDEDHMAAFRSADDGVREMYACIEFRANGKILSAEKEEHGDIYIRSQRSEILPILIHE